jgi:hypothetical protein
LLQNYGNPNTAYIYVDAALEASQNISSLVTIDTSPNPIYIGAANQNGSPGNYVVGSVDDVRIYNYALNQTQIRTLYNENAAIRFGPLTGSP